jgi:S-adenosylmethionine:tRNA ribosyltransferase-isomerase
VSPTPERAPRDDAPPASDIGEPRPLTTAAFDYDLPADLIASHPAPERDASRLLVVRRSADTFAHRTFRDIIDLIDPGDVLVLNDTRVFPARLRGARVGGGSAEIVLLRPAGESAGVAIDDAWPARWFALVRPGARLRAGRSVRIADDLSVEIEAVHDDGTRTVRLVARAPVRTVIERHGHVPLPPYIEREPEAADAERYQTVYARAPGSVAAPTAGLHFTAALLDALRQRGVTIATVVLHVGAGTFRPVEVEDPTEHQMHAEWWEVTEREAERINEVRRRGGRLWAVGTTVARTLESAADTAGAIRAGSGWTRLFITPGYSFRAVDALITNFHLPRSTLIMLVSAFAGYERTRAAYAEAIAQRYRFYSYGDAMAIL